MATNPTRFPNNHQSTVYIARMIGHKNSLTIHNPATARTTKPCEQKISCSIRKKETILWAASITVEACNKKKRCERNDGKVLSYQKGHVLEERKKNDMKTFMKNT
jgi:hypothetical protein